MRVSLPDSKQYHCNTRALMPCFFCRVYCSYAGGCGSQCNEYQQNGGVKTQCTSDDKWPFNMCSCKNTWVHDSGDASDTGGWVAGKF